MSPGDYVNIGQLVMFTTLLFWLLSKVYEQKTNLATMEEKVRVLLETHFEKLEEIVQREKSESISAHRRIDIHDRLGSEITEQPFSSKLASEGKQNLPKLSASLKKLVYGGNTGE